MPNPYPIDLHRWASLSQQLSVSQISNVFSLSESTVRRYIALFHRTGDIEPLTRRHGPEPLMGDFERLSLLKIILDRPGIYLFEVQIELEKLGIAISVPTICRTLKSMGCTRQVMHHVAIQRSDECRARFMSEISIYRVRHSNQCPHYL